MAYILNKTDGTALVTVANNSTTGSDYSVTFIGKNYLPYGESLNENLLHLLENSASISSDRPENPVLGQTWYNKSNSTLYVCYQERTGSADAQFRALAKSSAGGTAPNNPSVGDLWYDSTTGLLKVYAGSSKGWVAIGPAPQADWAQTDGSQQSFIKNKPEVFTPDLSIKYKGAVLVANKPMMVINFTGLGVTASVVPGTDNNIEVNIPNSGGGSTVSKAWVGSTSPTSPTLGQLWYENNKVGRGFVYDGTQWVDFSPAIGGSTSAPAPVVTPVVTPVAASTSFTLATTDGSAKSMGVVLTPGTWQVILDTRLTTKNDYNHDATMTQSATVGSVTVTTSIKTNRGGGAGHGRSWLGATDIAVGEFTLTADTPMVMAMAAAVPGDEGIQMPIGSTLTLSKIAATDAQKIYSGTMPTFTIPSAGGVGVGQTWQNVTSNRVMETAYTNSTGAPIMIAIGVYRYNNSSELFVNSVSMGTVGGVDGGTGQLTAIVPVGGTYRMTGAADAIKSWSELR